MLQVAAACERIKYKLYRRLDMNSW